MKIFKLIILFCIVILSTIYFFKNYLPPRTAYKVARINSDCIIKDEFKVIEFKEEYSFNGEGFINIIFKLSKNEIFNLTQSCKEKNYKKNTIENLIKDKFIDDNEHGINLYSRDIRKINGYYKLSSKDLKKLDFSITVLDTLNNELIIYVSIP